MDKFGLLIKIEKYKAGLISFEDIENAVEQCTTESNGAKPIVSGSLPFAELGEFVDWIRDIGFKQYAEGWCQAGGSNGWHCTTDELIQMFRDRGNDR